MLPYSKAGLRQLSPHRHHMNGHAQHSSQRVVNLFNTYGSRDYISEPLSIREHSLKAALAARRANEPIDVQLACLLHDIGHIVAIEAGGYMEGCGAKHHEHIGADFLERLGFSDTIVYLTRQHVNVKRYLCGKDPKYIDTLSEASKTTLWHQGGPMNMEECVQAENDPLWDTVLRMRQYDNAGKHIELCRSSIQGDYANALYSSLAQSNAYEDVSNAFTLSDLQLKSLKKNGVLLVKDAIPRDLVQLFGEMTDDLLAKREKHTTMDQLPWMVHFEKSKVEGEIQICRVENFVKHHEMWEHVCNHLISPIVSQALGEESVLFEDKINFKGPGGGGFACHQDATAYATNRFSKRHVSVLLAIDEITANNGPVEVAPGEHKRGILSNTKGIIANQLEDTFEFSQVLASPGDLLLFDSYLPHRSAINTSESWHRAAYFTFNAAREGDFHAEYYQLESHIGGAPLSSCA